MFSKDNNDSHKEERYQFMREQVKPQKRKQLLVWAKRLGILSLSACVFGGIVGGIICIMMERADDTGTKNVVKINTYDSKAETTAGPDGTSAPGSERTISKKNQTIEGINRLSEQLASIGNDANASIVGVQNKSDAQNWFSERQNNSKNVAFGVIYKETSTEYYIATVCDIVKEQPSVNIQLLDETSVEGKILGSDAQLNVAVVSIEKKNISAATMAQMEVADLDRGNEIRNGTNVIAIGSPNGVLYSVMTGCVSNNKMSGSITDGEVKIFCTNMPYSEESNGVILNTNGKVVGMITTKFTLETGTAGIAFVDMSNISTVLELLRHKQSVTFMGIEGESINSTIASAHDLEIGAYVKDVYAESPAYLGGMRVADIITKIDGAGITGMTDVYNTLLQHSTGDEIVCTVYRKSGKKYITKDLKIKLQ